MLEKALKENGYSPELKVVKVPQLRAKQYLETGRLSVLWMMETAERNERFVAANVGLTNDLIGKRILLIRKTDQHLFDKVSSLEDFRALQRVAGLGERWFDVRVWKVNNLLHHENSGNWKAVFMMLAQGRDYDYFPRGGNEIVEESTAYPELTILKRLVFIYDRDFLFYLSTTGEHAGVRNREAIESSLAKARGSGLLERLVVQYWGESLEQLGYDQRVKVHLTTPEYVVADFHLIFPIKAYSVKYIK